MQHQGRLKTKPICKVECIKTLGKRKERNAKCGKGWVGSKNSKTEKQVCLPNKTKHIQTMSCTFCMSMRYFWNNVPLTFNNIIVIRTLSTDFYDSELETTKQMLKLSQRQTLPSNLFNTKIEYQ